MAVTCDDDMVDQAVDILDGDEGILDLDEQQASWRSEVGGADRGRRQASASGLGATSANLDTSLTGSQGSTSGTGRMRAGSTTGAGATGRDEVIPVAEEELHVGSAR